MAKTFDSQDFQESPRTEQNFDASFDAKFEPNPCEVSEDVRAKPANFPLSRRQAAKHLGMSDVGLGKIVKKIQARVTITDATGRITEDGYRLIVEYRASGDREAFLDEIAPTVTVMPSNALAVRHESSIALSTDFDSLYAEMASGYLALNEAETRTMDGFDELKAELIESDRALAQSLAEEAAIGRRAATMRGIQKAMAEFSEEQKAYAAALNKLRIEGKFEQSLSQ